MVFTSIKQGFTLIKKRLRLVGLLYLINLVVALIVALPFYNILFNEVGNTGFGVELSEAFDPVLWSQIFAGVRGDLQLFLSRVLWVIPVLWIWKTASQVGVIYALHHNAIWPFWRGVGFYTGSGLLLGLLFLPLKVVWVLLIYFSAVVLAPVLDGEVITFWVYGVALPVVLIAGLSILELYQRFGRLSLVIGHKKVWRAMKAGFKWPQRYPVAAGIFICWYGVMLVLLIVSAGVNARLHVGFQPFWIAFLIQQVLIFARSTVTVGWIGSEVFLYENKTVKQHTPSPVKNTDTSVGTTA